MNVGSFFQSKKANSPNPERSIRFRNCLGMIWSVSTSARLSGIACPATVVTCLIVFLLPPEASLEVAHVHEMAGDRRGGGHLRADEVRAAPGALPPLEVAVAGAGAALAGQQDVRVHSQPHPPA